MGVPLRLVALGLLLAASLLQDTAAGPPARPEAREPGETLKQSLNQVLAHLLEAPGPQEASAGAAPVARGQQQARQQRQQVQQVQQVQQIHQVHQAQRQLQLQLQLERPQQQTRAPSPDLLLEPTNAPPTLARRWRPHNLAPPPQPHRRPRQQQHPQPQPQPQQQQQQQQHQHLQQHQQTHAGPAADINEISCDELSLVVLAQRVLKVDASTSAISRLIECQHLDVGRRRPVGHQAAPRAPAQGHQRPREPPTPELDQGPTGPADQSGPQFIRVPDAEARPPAGLHFGAQVSLSLLLATILLVILATLVDCQLGDHRLGDHQLAASRGRQPSDFRRPEQPEQQQQAGLRDYRSASISSSCSSSLFCSSNSVASSSIPILKAGLTAAAATTTATTTTPSSSASLAATTASGPAASRKTTTLVPNNSFHLMLADVRARRQSGLAKQLVLAFSLRQSVRQIFGQAAGKRTERALEAEAEVGGEPVASSPSRMGSVSSMSELDNGHLSVQCEKCRTLRQLDADSLGQPQANYGKRAAGRAPTDHHHGESIDALHGIRFLSMIWVIVIHSYNFALRWLFFTNTTTVEGIYKTLASQLLANGSFACDSFFFAGGFLVPYLAIPAAQSISANQRAGPPSGQRLGEQPETGPAGGHLAQLACTGDGPDAGPSVVAMSGCSSPASLIEELGHHHQAGFEAGPQAQAWLVTCCSCFARFHWPTATSPHLGPPRPFNLGGEQLDAGKNTNELPSEAGANCLAALDRARQRQPVSSCYKLKIAPTRVAHGKPTMVAAQGQDGARQANDGDEDGARRLRRQQQWRQARGGELDSKYETKINIKQQRPARKSAARRPQSPTGPVPRCTLSFKQVLLNILHRYVRMMPLMMAIIGLSATLLRYLGDGPNWDDSTMMYDKWCRSNWWINLMFMHNFLNRENMCLSHSWYSAVDLQLFLIGQLIMFLLFKSRKLGLALLLFCLIGSQLITASLTLAHHLPAVPLIASVSEQTMNLYYGEIYIKPYCRASPYLIGLLLAYLMRTTSLGKVKLTLWPLLGAWLAALSLLAAILFIMQPAMNGHSPSELQSALYSALSRPLWACATGWMVFACMTNQAGPIGQLLGASCFVPFSRLTYPAFLIHPIVMAVFYGSSQSSFHFSHYLMLYLIIGNIVITYACAFILATLFELPLLSIERILRRNLWCKPS